MVFIKKSKKRVCVFLFQWRWHRISHRRCKGCCCWFFFPAFSRGSALWRWGGGKKKNRLESQMMSSELASLTSKYMILLSIYKLIEYLALNIFIIKFPSFSYNSGSISKTILPWDLWSIIVSMVSWKFSKPLTTLLMLTFNLPSSKYLAKISYQVPCSMTE